MKGKAASEALLLPTAAFQWGLCYKLPSALPQQVTSQKTEGFFAAHRSIGWFCSCVDSMQAFTAAASV